MKVELKVSFMFWYKIVEEVITLLHRVSFEVSSSWKLFSFRTFSYSYLQLGNVCITILQALQLLWRLENLEPKFLFQFSQKTRTKNVKHFLQFNSNFLWNKMADQPILLDIIPALNMLTIFCIWLHHMKYFKEKKIVWKRS